MSDNETEKNTPGVPSNWRYNPPNQANSASMAVDGDGPSINPSPSSLGSTSTMDIFSQPQPVWENTHSQFLGYNVMNLQNVASSSDDLMMKAGLLLPNSSTMLPHHSLSPFPADSAFIERAARFSCFSSETMVDMINPFGIHQSAINHYDRGEAQNNLSSASHNVLLPEEEGGRQNSGGFHQEATKHSESGKVETAGCEEEGLTPLPLKDTDARVSSSEGLHFRKRKRLGQDTETEESPHQADKAEKGNGDNKRSSPCPATSKNSGKNGKQSSDASDQPKEDYIHIRARRGQATNSHSLAERVRREKISERMKFLQDLVPGCNKVTGKAIMLDEIINYVQSLQRQVEFLSMKLSTVNPRLNFDIESFLEKDPTFGPLAGPASWGLAPDMHMGYLTMHPPEQSHTPPNLAPTSDALTNITSQLIGVSAGYKEPTCQPPNAWDDELHNVVQMGFNPVAAHSSSHHDKETNTDGNLPTGLMKVEL